MKLGLLISKWLHNWLHIAVGLIVFPSSFLLYSGDKSYDSDTCYNDKCCDSDTCYSDKSCDSDTCYSDKSKLFLGDNFQMESNTNYIASKD